MTNYLNEARKWMTGRVVNNLSLSHPTVLMKYPNKKINQPENEIWADMNILWGEGLQVTVGGQVVRRHSGILQFTVYVPEDAGTDGGNILAEFLGNLFERQQVRLSPNHAILFRVPSYSQLGQIGRGASQTVVRIPFTRDEKSSG